MNRAVRCVAVLMMTALLIMSFTSCDVLFGSSERGIPQEGDSEYVHIAAPSYTASPYYQSVVSTYSYGMLSEGQQALYDALVKTAYDIYPEKDSRYTYRMPQVILDDYTLSDTEISVTLRAIMDDDPYLFWLSQTHTVLNDPELGYTAVQLYSEFSPTQVTEMMTQIDKVIGDFYASVPDGMSDYELEKYVHDYVIGLCDYDDADVGRTELSEENLRSHSVYGALVDKLCVCEGYGMTAQLLMNGLGLDCVCLTGTAYDGSGEQGPDQAQLHLWNAVKLDGDWYHVDLTWDDREEVFQRYDYFNLDDSMMLTDHTLSELPAQLGDKLAESIKSQDVNIYIPSCNGTEYYYYSYSCPRLISLYDTEALEESLYQSAAAGEQYFLFYIDPSLDYDSVAESLFKSGQYFFDYLQRVNERLYDTEVDDSNVVYYSDADRRTLAVELKYF